MASESFFKSMQTEHSVFYADSKASFIQEVDYVLLDKKLQNKVLKKQEDIDKLISNIKQQKQQPYKKYFTEKCKIVNENGKDILCQLNLKYYGGTYNVVQIKQILCLDDLFNILFEFHMQRPDLGEAHIVEHFSNCGMFESLIRLFWQSCKACKHNISTYVSVKCVGEMALLSMDPSDGHFKFILLYVERNTNYVLLRPLNTTHCREIAHELLSIFADFGSPSFVDSDTFFKTKVTYKNVLKVLNSLAAPFKMPSMYASSRNHKIEITVRKAKAMLNDWMEQGPSTNWAIGAHVVQWLMNNDEIEGTYIRSRVIKGPLYSPYHAMFGTLPHSKIIDFKKRPQPASVPSNEKVLVDCSQCNQPIYKTFKCHSCKGLCHFFCCIRYVGQTEMGNVLINKCFSCANICDDEVILGT